MRPKEVIHALERAGYFIHETTGSHVQMKHPQKMGRITVPYHQHSDLPKRIIKSIVKQAGWTNKQFLELLRR
ncbi:MAG: type II toxin-antitoxin system HicA family toxin [Acidobacteria bacterium]|nr:type II toxin-antitoxin system HicA family toxin [Acidobacteriota bacterium]